MNKRKITIFLATMLALVACGGTPSSAKPSEGGDSIPQPSQTNSVDGNTSKQDSQSNSGATEQSSQSSRPSSAESTSSPVSSSESSSDPKPVSSSVDPITSESSSTSSSSVPVEDPFEYDSYLLKHAEGQSANYVFEAECTDLRGKSGSGYSGGATGSGMATHNSDNIGFVTFLYTEGVSVNFFIVCDRDVTDAKLRARFGAEFIYVLLNPDNYTIRVDQNINKDYLVDFDPDDWDSEGCLGNWDDYFLNYYDITETDGYYIKDWECEQVEIDASGSSEIVGWNTFDIYFSLSLKKGVNCISLITDNDEILGDAPHGTMTATAPVIDYISIETKAQLGAFNAKDNGEGENAVHF